MGKPAAGRAGEGLGRGGPCAQPRSRGASLRAGGWGARAARPCRGQRGGSSPPDGRRQELQDPTRVGVWGLPRGALQAHRVPHPYPVFAERPEPIQGLGGGRRQLRRKQEEEACLVGRADPAGRWGPPGPSSPHPPRHPNPRGNERRMTGGQSPLLSPGVCRELLALGLSRQPAGALQAPPPPLRPLQETCRDLGDFVGI